MFTLPCDPSLSIATWPLPEVPSLSEVVNEGQLVSAQGLFAFLLFQLLSNRFKIIDLFRRFTLSHLPFKVILHNRLDSYMCLAQDHATLHYPDVGLALNLYGKPFLFGAN